MNNNNGGTTNTQTTTICSRGNQNTIVNNESNAFTQRLEESKQLGIIKQVIGVNLNDSENLETSRFSATLESQIQQNG